MTTALGVDDQEEEFTYQDRDDTNGWRKIGNGKKSKYSPKMEEQIKNLFRELARRFHPDLTSDPEEKKWREEVMTRVNQAYANRDLKALRALAEQPDRQVDAPNQTKEQEIAGLRVELKRLDGVIADLKARIKTPRKISRLAAQARSPPQTPLRRRPADRSRSQDQRPDRRFGKPPDRHGHQDRNTPDRRTGGVAACIPCWQTYFPVSPCVVTSHRMPAFFSITTNVPILQSTPARWRTLRAGLPTGFGSISGRQKRPHGCMISAPYSPIHSG